GPATLVDRIGIVVSDTFPSKIVVGAHHTARNHLRAAAVNGVTIWVARVRLGDLRSRSKPASHQEENLNRSATIWCSRHWPPSSMVRENGLDRCEQFEAPKLNVTTNDCLRKSVRMAGGRRDKRQFLCHPGLRPEH